MKILKIIILGLLTGLLIACENDKYENVFDEAPEQRRKEYFEQLRETLVKPEKGWAMQYYPSTMDQQQKIVINQGYNITAVFDPTGTVKLGAKHQYTGDVYTEYTGNYNLTIENGPALIFTTYNKALHPFADPDINQAAVADFEFIVFDMEENSIRLRGKWTNTEILLTPIPAGTTGEEYVLRAEETKQFLCPKGGPELVMEAEDKTFSFYNGYTSIFAIMETGVDTVIVRPFIATADGLRLYKPLEIGEKKLQNFQLTNNRNELVCTDPGVNAQLHINISDVPGFFLYSFGPTLSNSWKIDRKSLGGVFAEAYTQIVNNCTTIYKEDFESLFLAYKLTRRSTTLSFRSGKYEGAFNFGITLKEGTSNQIVFTNLNSADGNGNVYLKNIPGFDTFINELGKDSYVISTESAMSVSIIKFTQASNSNNWFNVMLNY